MPQPETDVTACEIFPCVRSCYRAPITTTRSPRALSNWRTRRFCLLRSSQFSVKSLSCDAADDDWSEDEAEIPAGVTDSMLTATGFLNDSERQHIDNFAWGESSKPLRDQYSEELAYPGIFLGNKRPDDTQKVVSVYYSEVSKSEIRSDRLFHISFISSHVHTACA